MRDMLHRAFEQRSRVLDVARRLPALDFTNRPGDIRLFQLRDEGGNLWIIAPFEQFAGREERAQPIPRLHRGDEPLSCGTERSIPQIHIDVERRIKSFRASEHAGRFIHSALAQRSQPRVIKVSRLA